jgi:hypothetical protein
VPPGEDAMSPDNVLGLNAAVNSISYSDGEIYHLQLTSFYHEVPVFYSFRLSNPIAYKLTTSPVF